MKKLFSKAKIRILLGVIIVFAVLVGLGVNVQIKNVSDTNSTQTGSLALVNKDTKRVITIGLAGQIEAGTTVDYTATGAADNVVFTNAINALPSTGGEIHIISSGTFTFTGTVSRAINNVTISGTGVGTLLNYDASHALFSAGSQSGWVFRDFATDAGGITLTSATSYTLQNVLLGASYYAYRTSSDIASSQFDIPVGRSSSFTIAANDTSAGAKVQADYICDGTADDVQIQAAITALSSTGGKVTLLDGTYYIHTGLTSVANLTIEGQGVNTVVKLENAHNASIKLFYITNNYVTLKNMTIDGNTSQQASGSDDAVIITGTNATCSGLNVINCNHYGINANNASATYLTVDKCTVRSCYTGIFGYGQYSKIINCIVEGSTAAAGQIEFYHCSDWIVANCVVTGGSSMGFSCNQADGSARGLIVNNTFYNNVDVDINLDTASYVSVIGNECRGSLKGMNLEASDYCIVQNNHVISPTGTGISIFTGSDYNLIDSNTVYGAGTSADNTFNGITISVADAACTYNTVSNNVIRKGAAANLPKYGILIEATCNYNYVHGNDLYLSGKTGDFSDSGTGTLKRDNRNNAGNGMIADS